jgi:uncharacterized membrane protein
MPSNSIAPLRVLAPAVLAWALASHSSLAQQYTITDLGTLPGAIGAGAYRINNAGHVIGASGHYGFFWTPETGMVSLGPLPATAAVPDPTTFALGLSNTDIVVGKSDSPTFPKAVRWDPPHTMLDEPLNLNPGSTAWSEANGVNSIGQSVGKYLNSGAFWEAPAGPRFLLPALDPSHDFVLGYDINDQGVIVGQSAQSVDSGTDRRAARWRIAAPGVFASESLQVVDLRLGGGALAVNELGAAAGWVKRPVTYPATGTIIVYRAAVWNAGSSELIEPGTINPAIQSVAHDLNDSGTVVGESFGVSGLNFAFAWAWSASTGFIDLNTHIPSNAGWRLTVPRGINNRGQIVGEGVFNNSQNRAFLLTPVVDTCAADFNHDGAATLQDLFDFLAAYFAVDPGGDFNQSGAVSVQDIFDFLAAYFAGCA